MNPQIASTIVTRFYKYLGVQTKFVSIVHLQANDQNESANKVILEGLKRKLDDAKGLWAELLPKMFWLYHTTPYSNIKETMVSMVYRENFVSPVEIDTPLWRRAQFNKEASKI